MPAITSGSAPSVSIFSRSGVTPVCSQYESIDRTATSISRGRCPARSCGASFPLKSELKPANAGPKSRSVIRPSCFAAAAATATPRGSRDTFLDMISNVLGVGSNACTCPCGPTSLPASIEK